MSLKFYLNFDLWSLKTVLLVWYYFFEQFCFALLTTLSILKQE
jgi:hypothetical protein